MTNLAAIFLAAYCGLLILAALQDLRSLKVSNILSVGVLIAAVGTLVAGGIEAAWWEHLASFAIVFAVGTLLFAKGVMGGGDTKLLAGASALFSLMDMVWFIVATTLAGGALTIVLLVVKTIVGDSTNWKGIRKGRSIPYAVAIAIGGVFMALITRPELSSVL